MLSRRTIRSGKVLVISTFVVLCGVATTTALAQTLDEFGPPPADDPSAFTGPLIGDEFAIDFLENEPKAYEGAFEGSSEAAARANLFIPPNEFDIPTDGIASPLFGAQPFNQKMFRFEEFGTNDLATAGAAPSFPLPTTGSSPAQDPYLIEQSSPDTNALDQFLDSDGISPFPMQFANDIDENPWQPQIANFLGRPLDSPPAEGRPPGQGWAHQRWNEFNPQVFFTTLQAGARPNGGIRDCNQRHGYGLAACGAANLGASEFAPGGLYHNTTGRAGFDGTTSGIPVQFHPDLPVQDHKALWTFDGTFPPKLASARYGQPILMRHYNALPIDPAANRGFGLHTITTHEHNGHNPAESDGFLSAFFFPGQFYDYRWPMTLAGYDTVNTKAKDKRAAFPCEPGETLEVFDRDNLRLRNCPKSGRIKIRGDWRETMSTHWFHDHMFDFTAQNVYKGNAAMFNYYSALDRGNEAKNDRVNLRFPSGTALNWGNRDYDVNLLLADKAWDSYGQLWFNIFNLDGFIGDQLLTNWQYKPYLDVRARRYRFRILNGSVSRYFTVSLVREIQGTKGDYAGPPGSGVSYKSVPFHMIANDGNIMEHTVPFTGKTDLDGDGNSSEHRGNLPTLAIAERYDIVVDFKRYGIKPGDKLYFVNRQEHADGRRPKDNIPLKDILDGSYKAELDGNRWRDGDPVVGKFLELRVHAMPDGAEDLSMNPYKFEPGKQKMIPLPIDRNDPQLQTATRRNFSFGRSSGTDEAPWTVKTDGGDGLIARARRISAAPQLATGPTAFDFNSVIDDGFDSIGRMEIWELENGGGGWAHPIHIHFEEGVILSRDGELPPVWELWARKDVYRVGNEEDSSDKVTIAMRFREFAGTFMEHCHNTQHEDHAMLVRWDLEFPGQLKLMPTPIPTWDGVEYADSAALPTFRSGDGIGPSDD